MIEKLLQYHQNLVSQEFIEKLLQRINYSFRLRHSILAVTSILGLIAGLVGFIKLWPANSEIYFLNLNNAGLGEHTLLAISLSIVGLLAFIAWLFNDEFERP